MDLSAFGGCRSPLQVTGQKGSLSRDAVGNYKDCLSFLPGIFEDYSAITVCQSEAIQYRLGRKKVGTWEPL